jgi:hypothetical protein
MAGQLMRGKYPGEAMEDPKLLVGRIDFTIISSVFAIRDWVLSVDLGEIASVIYQDTDPTEHQDIAEVLLGELLILFKRIFKFPPVHRHMHLTD